MIKRLQNTDFLTVFVYIAILILFFWNCGNFFFWDTVQLGSKHANFYLSTHFSELLLPDHIDSGHIPTFGIYIAFIWEIFGRSLIAAHLAMLPFVLGIVFQLSKLCKKFIPEKYIGIALLLVICDPTLLSQMVLVSPDVPLFFFFLLGINAVLDNRKWLFSFAILFLFLTSMRGMMISLCLLALDLYCNFNFRQQFGKIAVQLIKRSVLYFPALFLFLAYNGYHYQRKGWIGFHKDSPWAESFASVDFTGFLYNIGVLGWRILDFGRIGIWIVLIFLTLKFKRKLLNHSKIKTLIFFSVIIILILPINMLWAKGLLGHRYLLPVFLVFSLLGTTILFSEFVSQKLKYILSSVWIIILLTGNLWIYPPQISQGWDATLAHLPYYKLRTETLEYLKNEHIDSEKVSSFFPNIATFDEIDLNDDQRNFSTFDGKSEFVIYSNVYNVDQLSFELLTQNYKIRKDFSCNGLHMTVYQLK